MTASPSGNTSHPTMSATATLSNLYVPLPLTGPSALYDPHARRDDSSPDNNNENTNVSKRGARTLRRLHLSRSTLSQSSGSSLVELGNTKLLVSVRGPRSVARCSFGKEGGLVCEVRYLPHIAIRTSTLARHSLSHDFSKSASSITAARVPRDTLSTSQDTHLLSSGGSPCAPAAFLDETYLSNRLYEALAPAVVLDGLEKSKMCIEVFVQVLQSDGGVLGAAIVGASLALVDAGVGMKDLVCGSSAAVMRAELPGSDVVKYVAVADPTEDEILQACGVVTIAMMPNWKEVTVWDQFGKMSVESYSEAMELARDGCLTMHRFLKNCLNDARCNR
ncbi:hypothetical protein ACHAW6_002515 [Cyclotella cf. meneghiniana]